METKNKFYPYFSFLLFLCVSFYYLHAETTETTNASKTNLAHHLPISYIINSKAASSSFLLNREYLKLHHSYDINDILAQIPGAYSYGEDGYGLFANIGFRGIDANRSKKTTFLVDGIPIAPAPYSAPSAYATPLVGNKFFVEAIKGARQLLYGYNTTGGVINYTSTPIPNKRKINVNLQYGSTINTWENFRLLDIAYGEQFAIDKNKKHLLSFFISHTAKKTDGYKQFTDVDSEGFDLNTAWIDSSETDSRATSSHHAQNTGHSQSETTVKLKYRWQKNKIIFKHTKNNLNANASYTGISSNDITENPFARYSGTQFDNIKSDQNLFSLSHYFDSSLFNIGSAFYHNTFYRNWRRLDPYQGGGEYGLDALTFSQIKGETNANWHILNNKRYYLSSGLQSKIKFLKFKNTLLKNQFSIIANLHTDSIYRYAHEDIYTVNDEGVVDSATFGTPGNKVNKAETTDAISFALNEELQIKRFHFNLIGRGQWISQSMLLYSRENSQGRHQDPIADSYVSADFSLFSFGGNVHYQIPRLKNTLYISAHQGHSIPTPAAHVNSNVNVEVSWQYEIGFKDRKKNFAYNLGYFALDVQDSLLYESIGLNIDETVNRGNIFNHGVELFFELKWTSFFNKIDFFKNHFKSKWVSSFTYIDGRYTETKKKVEYTPSVQCNTSLITTLQKYSIAMSLQYFSEIYLDSTNTETLPARTTVNISQGYQISKNWKVSLDIKNLFNSTQVISDRSFGYRIGKPLGIYLNMQYAY